MNRLIENEIERQELEKNYKDKRKNDKIDALFSTISYLQDYAKNKGIETRTYLDEILEYSNSRVYVNFYKYTQNAPILKVLYFKNLEEAKIHFKNSEWIDAFYYKCDTNELILKESNLKKSTKKENIEQLNSKKVDKLTMQSFYEVVYTKPASNWNTFEITFADKDLDKIKALSIESIKEMFDNTISAKKDKAEYLTFTTLEKETLTDKDKKKLFTKYKSQKVEEDRDNKCAQSITLGHLGNSYASYDGINPIQSNPIDIRETHTEIPRFNDRGFNIISTMKPKDYLSPQQGVKYNKGKLPLDMMITKQFPNALEAVCKATEYGHQKYLASDSNYLNFKKVDGGSQTYADALMRHNLHKNEVDEESGLPHIYLKCWNALAELEIWIEENKIK